MPIGIIYYNDIVISESPPMLKGRLQFYQELLYFESTDHSHQKLDKKLVQHHEVLFTSIQKEQFFKSVDSALDLTRFFMMEYNLPVTLHDQNVLTFPLIKKSAAIFDQQKQIASPSFIAADTSVSLLTTKALHLFFFHHPSTIENKHELLQAAGTMFTHIHGGTFTFDIMH